MKILVAYESKGGTTERLAQAIGAAARGGGDEVEVAAMKDVTTERAASADLLIAGAWVQGFLFVGVGPAHAAHRFLDHLPELKEKPCAVFCTYALNPRGTLGSMRRSLENKGAKVLGAQAFNRRAATQGAEAFAHTVVAAAKERLRAS